MVITPTPYTDKLKFKGQSVQKIEWKKTDRQMDGQMDRQMDRRMLPIALRSRLTRSVITGTRRQRDILQLMKPAVSGL